MALDQILNAIFAQGNTGLFVRSALAVLAVVAYAYYQKLKKQMAEDLTKLNSNHSQVENRQENAAIEASWEDALKQIEELKKKK